MQNIDHQLVPLIQSITPLVYPSLKLFKVPKQIKLKHKYKPKHIQVVINMGLTDHFFYQFSIPTT